MPVFEYVAKDFDGKKFSGELEASNLTDLKLLLKRENKLFVSAKIKKNKKPNLFFQVSSKVPTQEIVLFIRQLSVMITAGISVEDSIRTIALQTTNKTLKNILISTEEELYKGSYFSEALGKFPRIFPTYFRNMIYIGEASGQLPKVLVRAAEFYERDSKMKRKSKTAMIYPSFLFVAITAVFIFLITFIVPRFEKTLGTLGTELPKITLIVLGLSNFFQNYGGFVLTGLVVFLFLIVIWFRTPSGKHFKDSMMLKIPVIKNITYYLITTRFSRGLAVLVSNGMNVMDSIEMIGKLMDNVVFESKFQYVVDEIKRGKKINKSLDNMNFFPKMLVEMVSVGESTGNLGEVLEITSSYYDERLEQSISRATQLLEPIMIVFAGLLVGFVVLSVFLPMISVISSVNGG